MEVCQSAKDLESTSLAHQVHRIGYHIREAIIEEAKTRLNHPSQQRALLSDGLPEPIPTSQTTYNAQVDAAIRDLFPRIPNTDRQEIIEHAFSLVSMSPMLDSDQITNLYNSAQRPMVRSRSDYPQTSLWPGGCSWLSSPTSGIHILGTMSY